MLRTHSNYEFSCRNCDEICGNKEELNYHIIENHKSYKPCRNFATNNCEYKECRFNHVVLKQGEQVCYKCNDKFTRKSMLPNHIRNIHNDPCLKFQEGNCTYGAKCVFKHIGVPAQNVTRRPKHIQNRAPHIESQEDFPPIPITGNRLMGSQTTKDQTMFNMSQLINQMSQIMNQMMKQ